MAATRTFLSWVCVVVVSLALSVNSETTPNGTEPSTSDAGKDDDGLVLDRSMSPLYDMVKGFLGIVQTKHISDVEWLNLSSVLPNIMRGGGEIPPEMVDWQNWTGYMAGFAACIVFGLLFIIIMPIAGCCVCCCRCCGRCGGGKKVHDPKNAKCKRISFCTVLLILTTIMLAGAICAFVSNDLIHKFLKNEGNQGPVGKLNSAFSTLNKYVDDTIDDVEIRALGAFDSTRNTLVQEINSTAGTAVDQVADNLNASALIGKAEALSKKVNDTQEDLLAASDYLGSLKADGQVLKDDLNSIRSALEAACGSASCTVDASKYETDADFSGLSDLQTQISNVAKSLNMQKFIDEAKGSVDQAKADARGNIQTQTDSAVTTLDAIRSDIRAETEKFRKQFSATTAFASDTMRMLNQTGNPEVVKIYDYVWYGGIGLCCVYLLIVVCYYIGILFGLCGERPGYDAPCCHKGVGSNFLLAGVGFSFIFSWLLMLLTLIFFLAGGVAYTEVCRYFESHKPSELRPILDPLVNSYNLSYILYRKPGVHLDFVKTLEDCEKNEPIYQALKLDNLFNLSMIINLKDVNSRIDKIAEENFNLPEIKIINQDLEDKINDFGNSGLNTINFDEYRAQVTNAKLTRANLTEVAALLDQQAASLSGQTKTTLEEKANELRNLDSTVVRNMTQNVRLLEATLNSLEANKDVKPETDDLVASLKATEKNFNDNKNKLVKEMVTKLTVSMKQTTETNVNGLISDVETEVGRCKPMFSSIYMATDAVCVTVLNPFNSLWFGWGWCLFFFIPSIVFAILLAGLYRREEEYSEKDFDETRTHW